MKKARLTAITLCLLAVLCSLLAEARPSNKWRLQFSGGANSDGEIVITITPKGGMPITTTVAIEEGRSENRVAKDVVDGLEDQLDEEIYHVERDDGEDVVIKRRRGEADFEIEVSSNSVKGVRINIDRE